MHEEGMESEGHAISPALDPLSALKGKMEIITAIETSPGYDRETAREITIELRRYAQAALDEADPGVLKAHPDLTHGLRDIAVNYSDLRVVDVERGSIYQYREGDSPFYSWEEQVGNAVDYARTALELDESRQERRQMDAKIYGWTADLSDAVAAVHSAGHEKFNEALAQDAKVERVWTNGNVSVAQFENAKGVYGFDHMGVHRSDHSFFDAAREMGDSRWIFSQESWETLDRVSVEYERYNNIFTVKSAENNLQVDIGWYQPELRFQAVVSVREGEFHDPIADTTFKAGETVATTEGPSRAVELRTVDALRGFVDSYYMPINEFTAQQLELNRQRHELDEALAKIEAVATGPKETIDPDTLPSVLTTPEQVHSFMGDRIVKIVGVAEDTLSRVPEPVPEVNDGKMKAAHAALREMMELQRDRNSSIEEGGFSFLSRKEFVDRAVMLVGEARSERAAAQLQGLDDAFLQVSELREDGRIWSEVGKDIHRIVNETQELITPSSPLFQEPVAWAKRHSLEHMRQELDDIERSWYEKVMETTGTAWLETVDRYHNEDAFSRDHSDEIAERVRESAQTTPAQAEQLQEDGVMHMPTLPGRSGIDREDADLELDTIGRWQGGPFSGPPLSDRAAWESLYHSLHEPIQGRPEVDATDYLRSLLGRPSEDIDDLPPSPDEIEANRRASADEERSEQLRTESALAGAEHDFPSFKHLEAHYRAVLDGQIDDPKTAEYLAEHPRVVEQVEASRFTDRWIGSDATQEKRPAEKKVEQHEEGYGFAQ